MKMDTAATYILWATLAIVAYEVLAQLLSRSSAGSAASLDAENALGNDTVLFQEVQDALAAASAQGPAVFGVPTEPLPTGPVLGGTPVTLDQFEDTE